MMVSFPDDEEMKEVMSNLVALNHRIVMPFLGILFFFFFSADNFLRGIVSSKVN